MDYVKQKIDEFFLAAEPFKEAYIESNFIYFAVKVGDEFVIVQSMLLLIANKKYPFTHFSSENIRAGNYTLGELAPSPREFVDSVLSGVIDTPGGKLHFPPNQSGGYGVTYNPFHPVGLQSQNRVGVLRLIGLEQHQIVKQPFHDWELRAAPTPYVEVQELMNEYGLGLLYQDYSTFEAVHPSIALVDATSGVVKDKANLRVRLCHGLDPKKFRLGYRVVQNGQAVERGSFEGDKFEWIDGPDVQSGHLEFGVKESAVLQCIASYAGHAQHYWWISDPSSAQNARRIAYGVFDPKLEYLTEVLSRTSSKGHNARELESVVAWLLWMLGFNVIQLGAAPKMQDAADLIATVPSGHIAVIEVTTGTLKAEHKLALLHDRAQEVRRGLEASGARHLRVLTVMVTSQPRADVEVDLEPAEKLGILVMTREDLEAALLRTTVNHNPDKLFEDAEARMKAAKAKYDAQASLQFEGQA